MRTDFVIKTALGGLFLLGSAQGVSAPQDLKVKSVSVPAYNIITDTLIGLTPQLEGKRNDFLMQQVCDLARGDKTQQQVNQVLKSSNIDTSNIPVQGNPFSLLVNGDLAEQRTVCVSYLASSLFYPTDNTVFFKLKSPATANDTGDKKSTDDKKDSVEKVFDQAQFMQDARAKMAIAQATAQLYAVIAQNMSNDKNATITTYQRSIVSTVNDYAPEYFRTIKQFYTKTEKSGLVPVNINSSSIDVIDTSANELIQNRNNVLLRARGVDWLGNGKIFGKEYFVDVTIISGPVRQVQQVQHKTNNRKK